MTTDPFTTAARAEAGRRHPRDGDGYNSPRRLPFLAGAEWALDHLAAQEPTDAEQGALIATISDRTGLLITVEDARAALTAAKEARHG